MSAHTGPPGKVRAPGLASGGAEDEGREGAPSRPILRAAGDTTTEPHPPTQAQLDAAGARYKAAVAAMLAANQASLAATNECLAASAEFDRLRALTMPLRDCLLEIFDPAIQRSRPTTLRNTAARVHRDPAEVKAALDELVAEGLVRQVSNGYDAARGGAS